MALIAWTDFVLVPTAPISHLYYVPILIAAIASTDDLTGLHNLRSFEALCRELLDSERQRRTRTSVALLCLDVDRLKPLNDTFGHLTGADAVKWVGRVIRACLPSGAYACRYGGDEFAVVMSALDPSSTALLATCIQNAVANEAPVLDGRAFPPGTLSVSVGSASTSATGARAYADDTTALFTLLFREADTAMYENKRLRRRVAPRSPALVAAPAPVPLPALSVALAIRTTDREPAAAWSCAPNATREDARKPAPSGSTSK